MRFIIPNAGTRLFWIVTLLAFMILGLLIGMDLIKDYNSRNSAITSDIDLTKLETLMPSVTLCPHDILNQTKVDEFARKYTNNSFIESGYLINFLHQLSQTSAKKSFKFEENIKNNIPAQDYMQLIFNLSNYYSVRFNNVKAVKIMTEVGICYTIDNILSGELHTKKWSDLNPYPEYVDNTLTRTFNFGNSFPIERVIEHNITGNITIYVHSPYDIPTIWSRSALIYKNNNDFKSYNLKIFAKEINYESDLLSQTSPDVRNCRDISEPNLKLFPSTYSRNLCLMECRAHYIEKVCNCIPHFYSNKYGKNYKICTESGLFCFTKYFDIFRKINANTKTKFFKCDRCKPNCIDQVTVIKSLRIQNYVSKHNMSQINQIIDHSPLRSFRRSVMYTHFDIIVGLSGVLSTFLGICIYSLCDLIYHFTIRIYFFRNGYRGSVDEIIF